METLDYLSVPFIPQGRTRDGVDCWGLVCLIYAEKLGIKLPHYSGVDWEDGKAVSESVVEESKADWREIDPSKRREFDVTLLRIKGLPWHVGVILNNRSFIHATPTVGVCMEHLTSIHWKNRILGFYRHKSLLLNDL